MSKEDYLKKIVSVCDEDMSEDAVEFYEKFFSEYFQEGILQNGFRGDCIISLAWTFGEKNKIDKLKKIYRSYLPLFDVQDEQMFYLFRERYHCKSNFAVFPRELNYRRGRLGRYNDYTGRGTCDYIDVLLKIIRKYFIGCDLSIDEINYIDGFENWFDSYGKGEIGWRTFIDNNILNPLVNSDYEVKDLFSNPTNYQSEKCSEIVGYYHDFNWCLPLCEKDGSRSNLETGKKRVLNFMRNSLWFWDERAELLSEKEK